MPSNAPIRQRIVTFLSGCIIVLLLLCIGSVAGMSLLLTCVRDDFDPIQEITLYRADNLLLNLAVIAGSLAACWGLRRMLGRFLSKIPTSAATVALMALTVGLGTLWALKAHPGPFADAAVVTDAVNAFRHGDFSHLTEMMAKGNYKRNYFIRYPYQLGLALVYEGVQWVLGEQNLLALKLINVACLALSYLALIRVTALTFRDKRITLVTILLLGVFLQPVLFVTHMYGYFMGLAAGLWALYCILRYMENGHKLLLIPAALLMSFAILVKPNYWIFAVALIILLLLHLIGTKRLYPLAMALCLLLLPMLAASAVQRFYEKRAGTELGGGMPKTAWLAMGLQESSRAPGWYNEYSYLAWDGDPETLEQAKADIAANISQRLSLFARDPAYGAKFFAKKVMSQWGEPTFDSIWVSKINQFLADAPMTGLAKEVYYGRLGTALETYFRYEVKLIYLLAAAGLLFCLSRRHKENPIALAALPLIALGGFLYHLLFEAKNQYVLVYVILLLPIAAAGLSWITGWRFGNKAKAAQNQASLR